MQKKHIRQTIRQQRQQLTRQQQQQASQLITQQVLALDAFEQAQHIAAYIAHDHEIDTQAILLAALTQKKHCYLPVLIEHHSRQLDFYAYHPNDTLQKNRFGIDEPNTHSTQHIAADQLDIVFMPLVACDQQGNRIGRGAGYYDHTFAFRQNNSSKKPLLIGLCYDFQLLDHIPSNPWDVRLDQVIKA